MDPIYLEKRAKYLHEAEQAFSKLDVDLSGYISHEEIASVAR